MTYYDIIDDQWSYIFTLKDIYSQRILGLVPSLSMEASFASKCLEQAFAQRKDVGLGGCYIIPTMGPIDSKAYKKMLADAECLSVELIIA
ncbi:MAG: hypothetical protein IPO26_04125 [Saprospiraceae bacterium]|nr:hypothetical protein [Saprospiraceae bacterium]